MMVQKQKQMDPYAALGLSHSATAAEVKRAYREMARKFHPDRFVGHPVEKQQEAASRFAAGASAYALLSDPKRKAEYDHVYKYGGFDDVEDTRNDVGRRTTTTTTTTTSASRKQASSSASRKRKTAIGYNCIDPFAFLMTQGRIQSRRSAGVEIPARVNNLGGIRFAFSSGKVVRSPSGTHTCENRTTEYVHGQKFCRAERVTFFPDGRKEVVVNEGSDCFDDQAQQQTMFHQHGEQPWWVNAWQEVREKLTMCNNPCAAVTSH